MNGQVHATDSGQADVARISSGLASVTAAYDELASFVASFRTRPRAAAVRCSIAAAELAYEARLLDDGALDRWLEMWHAAGVFWVPLRPECTPTGDQSYFLDDRRRLGERVAWQQGPAAWAQQPASATVRTVGSVEAWPEQGAMVSRSSIVISQHRGNRVAVLAGTQLHRYERMPEGAGDHEWAIRYKVLLLPALASGTTNLAYLL